MNIEQLREYCLSLKEATEDMPFGAVWQTVPLAFNNQARIVNSRQQGIITLNYYPNRVLILDIP